MTPYFRVTVLGVGGMFAPENTAFLLTAPTESTGFVIDGGFNLDIALQNVGMTFADVGTYYTSHLHGDHVALEKVAYATFFNPHYHGGGRKGSRSQAEAKPQLVVPAELLSALWHERLKGSLKALRVGRPSIQDFFTLRPMLERSTFHWGKANFQIRKVPHMVIGGSITMYSWAVFVEVSDEHRILFTTDVAAEFCIDALQDWYREATIIFHDLEYPARTPAHPHFDDLNKLPDAIKKKIWFVHWQLPVPQELPDVVRMGFGGFAHTRQVFEFPQTKVLRLRRKE